MQMLCVSECYASAIMTHQHPRFQHPHQPSRPPRFQHRISSYIKGDIRVCHCVAGVSHACHRCQMWQCKACASPRDLQMAREGGANQYCAGGKSTWTQSSSSLFLPCCPISPAPTTHCPIPAGACVCQRVPEPAPPSRRQAAVCARAGGTQTQAASARTQAARSNLLDGASAVG